MTLIWIIGIAVATTGGALVVRGLVGRGTAGDPRCRGCGQQVTDEQGRDGPRPGDRCPECGRPLTGRGITRRRVHRGTVMVGLALLAIGLGGAAAWPNPGWRYGRLPTWWLLRVEWPLLTPETRPQLLEVLATRRAASAPRVSDRQLMVAVDELLRRLRSTPPEVIEGASLDPWGRLFEEAVAADLVTTPDVALVYTQAATIDVAAEPMPPDGLALEWRISRNPAAFAAIRGPTAPGAGAGAGAGAGRRSRCRSSRRTCASMAARWCRTRGPGRGRTCPGSGVPRTDHAASRPGSGWPPRRSRRASATSNWTSSTGRDRTPGPRRSPAPSSCRAGPRRRIHGSAPNWWTACRWCG